MKTLEHYNKDFLRNRLERFIPVLIIIVTIIVYWQVTGHDFISFDDGEYVNQNPYVQMGFTCDSIKWAFSIDRSRGTYWHPLTWISHMLDFEISGLNSGFHHFMNVIFHIANSFLLFLVLRKMTGSLYRSTFVAALFALHPINVDSVAWLAERKNLLSTFFWLLTILTYTYYVKKSCVYRYLLVFIVFSVGLLAKPMLVTLPFVLLLLDYWPLNRFKFIQVESQPLSFKKAFSSAEFKSRALHLVLEKIPLLIVSLFSIYISSISLKMIGGVVAAEHVPIDLRIENAVVSYVMYLWKMFWPQNLTFFYPFPSTIPLVYVVGSLLFLACITAVAIKYVFRQPAFIVGWLWYLGTLVPVIGLVQGGLWPAIAERWAYVPLIGIYVIIAWTAPEIFLRLHRGKTALRIVALVYLSILSMITWNQIGCWKNDFTLFSHGIEVNNDNFVAHANLGKAFAKKSDFGEAINCFKEVLRIDPNDLIAHKNLGRIYEKEANLDKASYHFYKAVKIAPDDLEVNFHYGGILAEQGKTKEAASYYYSALKIDPDDAQVHYNLGVLLSKQKKIPEARKHFLEAIKRDPQYKEAYYALGVISGDEENINDAITYLERAVNLDSNYIEAKKTLEFALKHKAQIETAIEEIEGYLKNSGQDSQLYLNLGDLYHAKGDMSTAMKCYEKALEIEPDFTQALHRLAVIYSKKGQYNDSLRFLLRIMKIQPDSIEVFYDIACVYAKQGFVDESIKWLDDAINKGFKNWDLLKDDRDLNNIRNTAYYKDLINRIEH